ncbi:MAG: hypothetical protein GC164_12290 [Phycisphaera sp.]|nr:hypothetical protein [Phycisphaera sp.]
MDVPTITAISPDPRKPRSVVIRVDGRLVAALSSKLAESLGLVVGLEWNDALAVRVRDAAVFDKALTSAVKMLGKRPMSRSRLTAKLLAKEMPADLVEKVCHRLEELGTLDDEALARRMIEEWTAARHSAGPRKLEVKLLQQGLDANLVERLLSDTTPQDTQSRANELAQRELAKLARLDHATQQRRLWSLLTRRGFDEDTARAAMDHVGLGIEGE